jgi:hypothetical protein
VGAACGGRRGGRVPLLAHGPTTEGRFNQPPIAAPPAVRCPRRHPHGGWRAGALRPSAGAIAPRRPGDHGPAPGFLLASAARAGAPPGPRLRGDHPRPLGQPWALGAVATRVRPHAHGRVTCGARLHPEPWVGLGARPPIRRPDHDGLACPALRPVTPPMPRRTSAPDAAEACIERRLGGPEALALLGSVVWQGSSLTGAGALLGLMACGHASSTCDGHRHPPGVPERSGAP